MAKDLTVSPIERQNILNNRMAIPRIQERLNVEAYQFEGKYYLTKQMVADFYEVDIRTIDNYLSSNEDELKHNGYFLCKGKTLKEFKLQFAHEINVGSKVYHIRFSQRRFTSLAFLLACCSQNVRVHSCTL